MDNFELAFEQIYSTYYRHVYSFLYKLCHDTRLAEDLTQETFYQALKGIDRFDESCKVSTWLCAIAKNQLAAYWRKHLKQEDIEDKSQVGNPTCSLVEQTHIEEYEDKRDNE